MTKIQNPKPFRILNFVFRYCFGFRNSNLGFTIIEAITSVSVFAIAMASIIGVYMSIQNMNAQSNSLQSLQQNIRFAKDDFTKLISNGQIDYASYPGATVSQPSTNDVFLLDQAGNPVHIYRSGDFLVLSKTEGGQNFVTNFSSSEVRILNFKAYIWPSTNPFPKTGVSPKEHPTVTIFLDLESVVNPRDKTRLTFQTTVATRQYSE